MTSDQYRTLYELLRQYQVEETPIGSRAYMECDTILNRLYVHYYNQQREQPR